MAIFRTDPKAFQPILNRPEAEAHVTEHFSYVISALEELLEYGTFLVPRCWHNSQKAVTDMVVLTILLKQTLSLLDAATVLLQSGCVYPAYLQLRALFEAAVYLDWMLLRDTEQRARAYYVANVRRALRWGRRARRGTPEFRALQQEIRRLNIKSRLHTRAGQKEVDTEIKRLEAFLRKKQYRYLNQRFENRRRGLSFDPAWYAVFFPKRSRPSLYLLCRQVKRLPEYRFIYEPGSEVMHSSRSDAHVRVENGTLWLRSLRELTDMGLVAQLLMGQVLHVYTTLLDRYRPAERENFARSYLAKWREPFLARRIVQYQFVEREVV